MTAADRNALFSEAFLRQLEHLAVLSRRPAAGHLRGHHRSRRTGAGMIFTDYRPYSPGDDTRHLDWGTYLRLDRLILRLFEEEADLPVYLFVDASGSMDFGKPSKFDFARRFAAALAYLALINHDRVSIVACGDGIMDELPARRGKTQVWRCLHFLERLQPVGATDLLGAVRRFFGARRTRGLVVLLSDFLDPAGFEPALAVLREFRQDVFAVHVAAAEEMQPELADDLLLVDAEVGRTARVLATPQLMRAYRDAFEQHGAAIEDACRANGFGCLHAATSAPLEDLVLKSLREKGLLR